MFLVDGLLDAIFLGCFLFGLLLSLVSLVFGDIDLLPDFGDGGDGGGWFAAFNLSSLLAFVAWFGGVGILARQGAGWPAAVSIFVAVVGGVAGAAVIGWFMARVIAPNDQALDPDDFRMPGTIGRLSSSIRAGGTGEVVYEQGGTRQVAAARASGGRAIPRGTEVVVVRSEAGVVLVEPADVFFGDEELARIGRPSQGVGDGAHPIGGR